VEEEDCGGEEEEDEEDVDFGAEGGVEEDE